MLLISPTKREKKFRQTFEKMEGFSFVTPVTGLNRPNTGREDDDALFKCGLWIGNIIL
jgi:hypothetical protein